MKTISKRRSGFTLIELLVVIAIIAILATLIIVQIGNARAKAKVSKAKSDIAEIWKAVAGLQLDTGKWPLGCPPGAKVDQEIYLNGSNIGLFTPPQRTATGAYLDTNRTCRWESSEVSSWKGPYTSREDNLVDPWGTPYYLDRDYTPGGLNAQWAVISNGPDKVQYNSTPTDSGSLDNIWQKAPDQF